MVDVVSAPPSAHPRSTALIVVLAVLIGVGSAALGLLPWLVTGLRLPLQNLWATATAPDAMPIVLLPFSQYAVALIAAIMVVGSAIAGIVARITRAARPSWWWIAIGAGVLAAQLFATVQTAIPVIGGLQRTEVVAEVGGPRQSLTDASYLYVLALVAGTIGAIVIGAVVLGLIARAPVPGATVAVSLAAVALGTWLDGLIVPFGSVGAEASRAALDIVRWIPGIVVGLAIVWCGVRTAGRIAAVVGGLLALWVMPAASDALSGALGSRNLLGEPAELVESFGRLLATELRSGTGTWPPVVLAVAIGVVGVIGAALWRRRGRTAGV